MKLPIRWDRMAKESLDQIYEYICQDSPQNGRKVKKELIKLVGSLNDFPEKYSREEFLEEVPGNYRSVSKWNYKVIYEVTEDSIIVVDIFQTRKHPSQIKHRIQSTKK
ncbi:MAG TPA: type II toxin-antitoxin system RelE/ParE family toxin [Prolixibacteraceae bacterium]